LKELRLPCRLDLAAKSVTNVFIASL